MDLNETTYLTYAYLYIIKLINCLNNWPTYDCNKKKINLPSYIFNDLILLSCRKIFYIKYVWGDIKMSSFVRFFCSFFLNVLSLIFYIKNFYHVHTHVFVLCLHISTTVQHTIFEEMRIIIMKSFSEGYGIRVFNYPENVSIPENPRDYIQNLLKNYNVLFSREIIFFQKYFRLEHRAFKQSVDLQNGTMIIGLIFLSMVSIRSRFLSVVKLQYSKP